MTLSNLSYLFNETAVAFNETAPAVIFNNGSSVPLGYVSAVCRVEYMDHVIIFLTAITVIQFFALIYLIKLHTWRLKK